MPKSPNQIDAQRKWLRETLPKHQRLAAATESLLENMLKKKKIEYLSVTSRTKTLHGALEKIRRKEYIDPINQLTDLSGIRIITYLEQQVAEISDVIRELFEIDKANSRDRAEVLGDDKVGYRSTHFVCTLGKERSGLPENESLGDLIFEIQVRTVLQHAWAELAHDRSFKFGAPLPTKIQRKLNLYSGLLEITDTAFNEISREIDAYSEAIAKKSINQISSFEIDSIALTKVIDEVGRGIEVHTNRPIIPDLYREMQLFGLRTIGDVRGIFTPDFIKAHKNTFKEAVWPTWLIRRALAYSDPEKYFNNAPKIEFMMPTTYDFLVSKFGEKLIKKILREHNITVR